MGTTTHAEAANEEQMLVGIGEVPENLASQLDEVDAFKKIPSVTPGKSFAAGRTLAGYYLGTKTCYSEKLAGNKRDSSGRKYRLLHLFKDHKGVKFGIWGVGVLDYTMTLIPIESFISVTYNGKDKTAIKPGQSVPHSFTIKGVNIDLDAEKMAQARELAADEEEVNH
ncbi:MAG: hypothetical protein H7836_04385 [Magnetococcus sp. YQC-3]